MTVMFKRVVDLYLKAIESEGWGREMINRMNVINLWTIAAAAAGQQSDGRCRVPFINVI